MMDGLQSWDVLEFGDWDFGSADSTTANASTYPSVTKRLLSVRPDGKKKSNKALSQHQLQELLDKPVSLRGADNLSARAAQGQSHAGQAVPADTAASAEPNDKGKRRDKKRDAKAATPSENTQPTAGVEPEVAERLGVPKHGQAATGAAAASGAAPSAATERDPAPRAKKQEKDSAAATAGPKENGAATSPKDAPAGHGAPALGLKQPQPTQPKQPRQSGKPQEPSLKQQKGQQGQRQQEQQQQGQAKGDLRDAAEPDDETAPDGPADAPSRRAAKKPRVQPENDEQQQGQQHRRLPQKNEQKQVQERLPEAQTQQEQQRGKAKSSSKQLARPQGGAGEAGAEAERGGDGAVGGGRAAKRPGGADPPTGAEAAAAATAADEPGKTIGATRGKQQPGQAGAQKRPGVGADGGVQEEEERQGGKPPQQQQRSKQPKGGQHPQEEEQGQRKQPKQQKQKQQQQGQQQEERPAPAGEIPKGGGGDHGEAKGGKKAAGKQAKAEQGMPAATVAPGRHGPVAAPSLAAALGGRAAVAAAATTAAAPPAGPSKATPAVTQAPHAAAGAAPAQKLTHAAALAALQKRNAASAAAVLAQPDDEEDGQGSGAAALRPAPGRPGAAGKKAGPLGFLDKMRAKLAGGRFRYLNEELYTRSGDEAFAMMQSQPELFSQYHDGFQRQTRGWPKQPVDVAIAWLRAKKSEVKLVADFGCGDAKIAASVPQTVHSFDLVASAPGVIACNMSDVPLPDGSVDAAIFSLALMGTDYGSFLEEAVRVIKPKGWLWIAEVRSRFARGGGGDGGAEADGSEDEEGGGGGGGGSGEEDFQPFLACLKRLGLRLVSEDAANRMFVVWVLRKGEGDKQQQAQQQRRGKKAGSGIPWPELKACVYKKR